jgi:3-oxoacyl-[acyl-carrier-protein] synthase-1
MSVKVAIRSFGMVTSVGLNAPAACAAIRAGVRNMSETRFVGSSGEPLIAAQAPLPKPWRGRAKLVKMLAASVTECLASVSPEVHADLPLLLCISEKDRPGRDDFEESVVQDVEAETGVRFSREYTRILPLGRASGLVAIDHARRLIADAARTRVLIAGVDTLVVRNYLSWLQDADRLLTEDNSNGVIPGEAAGCVLLERGFDEANSLTCLGLGFAEERVTIYSEEPFRADGLTRATQLALTEAGLDLAACGLRLTDISGEHYYFREAALTLTRLLRREGCREFWHPAECIGEVGAAVGPILLGYAAFAARKRFLPGYPLIVQASSDAGLRAAACFAITPNEHGE